MRASVMISCAVALVVAAGVAVILVARGEGVEVGAALAVVPKEVSAASRPTGGVVRVAVIGGMFETGFWEALAERYERESGVKVQLMASGPKDGLDRAMRTSGNIDLITMHASDAIVNLVADGYAMDPQPWLRNDMVLVGPASDPARIRGMADAAAALKKIAETKSLFVVHSSIGAREVLRAILDREGIVFDESRVMQLFAADGREVLKVAAEKGGYTMVGRIPFRTGKLPTPPNGGLELMVSGDDRLKRPYLVAVGNPAKVVGARVEEARAMAAWMRAEETQAWIAGFGVGKVDEKPIFFRVEVK